VTEQIRVGIIAPCPPPYGGITRVLENHLANWQSDEVAPYFIPMYPPLESTGLEGSEFVRMDDGYDRNWAGLGSYLKILPRMPLAKPWIYRHFMNYNRALSELVRRERLDVIYAHEVWPAGASAVLQNRIHGIPSVVVAYGECQGTTPEHRRWKRIGSTVAQEATHLIATSEHCLNGALALGRDESAADVVYAGIDLDRFNPSVDGSGWRQARGIAPEAVIVSVLGMVLRNKLDTFLDAVGQIDSNAPIVCLIGGAGGDEMYVRARSAGIEDTRIEMLGFVPEEELPEFYAATDILVASPRTLLECMGQSMKEAMACGTTVVGARLGGIPEAVECGVTGLLYEAEDAADLARAISQLADDNDARERMGAAGRKSAEEHFDSAISAEQTLSIFRRVVSEAR
jgi:glycosyltransferase involved in cell wall biosynthesis